MLLNFKAISNFLLAQCPIVSASSYFLFFVLLLTPFSLRAQDIVQITNQNELNNSIHLKRGAKVLVDPSNNLTIEKVKKRIDAFIPLDSLQMEGKYKRGKYAYWLYFEIENSTRDTLWPSLNCGLFDSLHIYQEADNFSFQELVGMKTDQSKRKHQTSFSNFSSSVLVLPPNTQQDIYIRINNQIEINRPIEPILRSQFLELEEEYRSVIPFYVFMFCFFGILIFVSLINIFQYVQVGDKAYLFYALYLLSIFIFYSRDFDLNSPTIRIWPIWFKNHF